MNKSHFLAYANHFKRLYAQAFQPIFQRYGLSQLEIDVLLFLHNNPGCNTARDIVELRGFSKSNVSTAVESLRKRGYLSVDRDPDNRRIQRLSLSDRIQGLLEELTECQDRCLQITMIGFSPEERAAWESFLERADGNVLSALENTPTAQANVPPIRALGKEDAE